MSEQQSTAAPEPTRAAEDTPRDAIPPPEPAAPETPAEPPAEPARVDDWAKASPLVVGASTLGIDPSSADWAMSLQPRDMGEAWRMATGFHRSGLYARKFKSIDAIWTVILLGREHGLSALAALQSLTIVEGKVEMDAALIVAKILRSGAARFFSLVESDDNHATWRTHRVGAEEKAISMTFTLADAKRRGLVRPGSNWERMPDVMCSWRCATKLGKFVYPDVTRGLYGQGEIREAVSLADASPELDAIADAALATRGNGAPAQQPAQPQPRGRAT